VHRVQQAERLHRAILQVLDVVLERHHPAHIDVPQVHRRMAVDDPVGKHFASTTSRLNPDRVEPAGHKEPAHVRR
jgi:hypothetical protein